VCRQVVQCKGETWHPKNRAASTATCCLAISRQWVISISGTRMLDRRCAYRNSRSKRTSSCLPSPNTAWKLISDSFVYWDLHRDAMPP
jgi:hypothetical protein